MGSDDQGPCFITIGIIIIVMTFIIWFNFFFLIIGVGFIMGGICLSQQKVKKTTYSSTTPSYQQQPVVQQAPQTEALANPQPQPPQPKTTEPELHKFCPHCGSPTTEDLCQTCGVKVD